jgi:stage II sporulation protein D
VTARTIAIAAVIIASNVAPAAPDPTVRVGFARRGGGYAVESVPLETYVSRVLAGEAAHDSLPAALDALAITIRTFALANRGRHRGDGFDLCDGTHCQVVRAATAATDASASRTAGRVLLAGGVPASIFYTASCGGRTEVPSAVWPGAPDPPFLPSKADTACGGAPVWHAELAEKDLLRALHAAGFRGDRLRALHVIRRDPSGRVARLRLEGLTPPEISGQDLRVAVGRTLGWQHIKSAAFDVTRDRDAFHLDGRGWGHGVGLCVIGSVRLAASGESAEDILERYFPGLAIGAGTAPAATVAERHALTERDRGTLMRLPDEDEGDRASLDRIVSRASDDLARTLGVAPPARLALRVHPTTESFEQATARPWFVSGALVRGELHLLPLAALRERGTLERTIRRELVHAMIDGDLGRRPQWVRDGAAVYYADPERGPVPAARADCPDDSELAQPVSAGALATAYARARACFARQVGSGRNWREVR